MLGNTPLKPGQAEVPRLLKDATVLVLSTAPAENPSRLLAGLMLVDRCGPELPAEKTTTIPADLSVSKSLWNVLSQVFTPLSPQEALTTSGASVVVEFPSGSRSHWNAWWMILSVVLPESSKIFAAIHVASGATPIAVPPALPPTMTPIVCVP